MNPLYGDFPPEEIAPFAYQTISPPDTRKGSSTTLSSNSDTNSYRGAAHRRTKSSDSDSALDSSSIYSIVSNNSNIHKEKEKKTIFPRLWFNRKNAKDKETEGWF